MKKTIRVTTLLAALLPLMASANEQPNRRTVTEQFQDWTLACIEQEQATICEARHPIMDSQGGVQGQISISKRSNQPEQQLFQVALPLLADLKRTVAIQIEGKDSHQFQYAFCSSVACFVAEEASEKMVSDFRKGVGFAIHSRNIRHGDVTLKGSLLGFSAAMNQLNKKTQPSK